MKKTLFLFLLFTQIIYAQNDSLKTNSNTIKFINDNNNFYLKEYYTIGKQSGVEFINLYVTNIPTKEKRACLLISSLSGDWTSANRIEYEGAIDSDEMQSCLNSLIYFRDNLKDRKPDTYTELIYISRDFVNVGAYYEIGSFAKWNIFFRTNRFYRDSFKSINVKHIDKIIDLFSQSKAGIDLFLK